MNTATKTALLRRLEQHFGHLQDEDVKCQWSPPLARLFEAACNGPYSDDQAQEAVDRLVDYSRQSRTVPRPEQLAGYLQRAGRPEPVASVRTLPKSAPQKLPKDPVCRMFGWKEPEREITPDVRDKLLLEGAGSDSQFARDLAARRKRREIERRERENAA